MKKVNYFSQLGNIFLCCESLLFSLHHFTEGQTWQALAWLLVAAASIGIAALPYTKTAPSLTSSLANFWFSMGFLLCGCAGLYVAYTVWNNGTLIEFFVECAVALMCISWSAEFWYSWIYVKTTPSE